MVGGQGRRGLRFAGSNWLRARVIAPAGAVAILAILVLGTGTVAATATPPPEPHTDLATIPLIDAIAATPSVVFAQGVTNCSQIYAISPWSNVSVYATVPVGNATCDEGSLVVAPALNCSYELGPSLAVAEATGEGGLVGEWGHTGCSPCHKQLTLALYDVVAGVLYEITGGGSVVTPIAKFPVPNVASENLGLAYDQVGLFNHSLIVTSSSEGKIWLVNATGNVTLLTELYTYIAGPAVAPIGFGSYGGDLMVAEKKKGHVEAITPNGTMSIVANWTDANGVAFPSSLSHHWWSLSDWTPSDGCITPKCTFGPNHDVLFVANYSSGALEAFPASDLQNFSGQGFVIGGVNHGIASFAANGTTTLFASQTERLSAIAFITCFSEYTWDGQPSIDALPWSH